MKALTDNLINFQQAIRKIEKPETELRKKLSRCRGWKLLNKRTSHKHVF